MNEENQKGNDIMSEQKDTEITEMVIKEIGGKRYYTRRDEAEDARRKGDRIYFKAGFGYYIRRPQKRDFWDIY